MRSLTFTLDTQTGSDEIAPATITIIEQADGTLSFEITNVDDGDNLIGDIRALFFDVSDDNLLGTLSVDGADVTQFEQDGDVDNLGGGATASGVPDSPYEVGIEIGTSGAATDDIQATSFTLSSSLRDLTLDDIALESFTVRQTSVGDADGSREGSDKLYGDAPYPVDAIDDSLVTDEDTPAGDNVFANDIDLDNSDENGDGIPDGLTVTAVNGDDTLVNSEITLASGAILIIDENGNYTVDPTGTLDWLAVGESIDDSFTYTVNDGNGGQDTATVNITINGVNDLPTAVDDTNTTYETDPVSGSVLDNDTDPDLSDTLVVSAVNGDGAAVGTEVILASGALLTLNEDGSYTYDPNGQFDALLTGESATDSFTYQVSDGNGGFDTATVTIDILGIGEGGGGGDDDHFGTFANKRGNAEHGISNIVLYLQDDDGITKVKIDNWDGGIADLDDVNLTSFLSSEFSDTELVAVSIKAGNNHNRDLGPGEGQLFLLDGDEDIDYEEGGDVPDPLDIDILGAKADHTYDYDSGLFA